MSLKMLHLFLAIGVLIPASHGQPPISGCRRVLDIVLVVDGSDSITSPNFEKIKASLGAFTRQLDIGADRVWLGLVLYSSDITETVSLQSNKTELLQKISQLKHERLGTNTAVGVQKMTAMLLSSRSDAPKMGVVITDGISLEPSATHNAALQAMTEGIDMYSVGIGEFVDKLELQGLSSGPDKTMTFENFDKLSLDSIGKEICPATTTTTRPAHVDPLCADCAMVNGAGYNRHPTDCDKFIQCYYSFAGDLVGGIQQCPFPTFWSMKALACVTYDESDCIKDNCANVSGYKRIPDDANCRGYWDCTDTTATPYCCHKGYRYDEASHDCVVDVDKTCDDWCAQDPAVYKGGCDLLAVPGNPNIFQQRVGRFRFVTMACAPGTMFNQTMCECSTYGQVARNSWPDGCKPELYLPFTDDTDDHSVNRLSVGSEDVAVSYGAGRFSGKSRLIVPRFTNLEHVSTIVIKLKYTSSETNSPFPRALVSNSDCGHAPSIMVVEDNHNIYFSVRTTATTHFVSTSVPRKVTDGSTLTQEVTYTFDEGRLTGSNGVENSTVDAPGTLLAVHCALHIGDADGLKNFVGEMDEVSVYLCNPDRR